MTGMRSHVGVERSLAALLVVALFLGSCANPHSFGPAR